MLVKKKDRLAVYSYLFREGVMTTDEKLNHKHHGTGVMNLYVINLMKSFVSREFVRQTFSWNVYYWFLTAEGVEYLREYLHVPAEIVPATLKSNPRSGMREGERDRPERGDRDRGDRGDRGPRRDGAGGGGDRRGFDKKAAGGAGPDWKPEYAGSGAGRGRGGRENYRAEGNTATPQ